MSTFTFPTICRCPSEWNKTGSHRFYHVEPGDVVAAAEEFRAANYFIEDVTALDITEGFEIQYHYDHFEKPGRLTVRTIVPHDAPEVPTISHIYQGANWHERECTDFYGITFTGHPNPLPLLLPEDMEEHPLIKSGKSRTTAVGVFVTYCLADCGECTTDEACTETTVKQGS